MRRITKKELLPLIKGLVPLEPVIVEAGCFDGRDTIKLSSFWPQGTVHAFEPVPEIFAMLTKATQDIPNVCRYPYALGAHTGTATLHISAKPDALDKPFQAGSLLQPKERLTWSNVIYPTAIEVPTITLDDWARKFSVPHVDFLWLDVQGFALPILQASPHVLATLKALYVEVEFIEAYEGQHQYLEVKTWLESHGFTMIARDFDDAPQWFFGNALFTKTE